MTNIEIVLSVAEVVTAVMLVRLHRKHLIVRHLFIKSSDWCASKIDEMTQSASCEIAGRTKASAKEQGYPLTDDEAQSAIPYVILNAKGEWQDQADHFQATLKHNGVSPLGETDLDALIFNPRLAGFKSLPLSPRQTRF